MHRWRHVKKSKPNNCWRSGTGQKTLQMRSDWLWRRCSVSDTRGDVALHQLPAERPFSCLHCGFSFQLIIFMDYIFSRLTIHINLHRWSVCTWRAIERGAASIQTGAAYAPNTTGWNYVISSFWLAPASLMQAFGLWAWRDQRRIGDFLTGSLSEVGCYEKNTAADKFWHRAIWTPWKSRPNTNSYWYIDVVEGY